MINNPKQEHPSLIHIMRALAIVLCLIVLLQVTLFVKRNIKITEENYRSIEIGMSLEEVESYLGVGKREQTAKGVTGIIDYYIWGSLSGKYVRIIFHDGKVSSITASF